MSDTKCYRRVGGFLDDTDRVRVFNANTPDEQWVCVLRDGTEVKKPKRVSGTVLEHVESGAWVEVPDCPANWPIIDGSPKNPAAFEALYRAAKDAVESLNEANRAVHNIGENHRSVGTCCDCYACSDAKQLTSLTGDLDAALAIADKGGGQ